MKFYIASRFGNKDRVREVYEALRAKGHEITTDWTVHTAIKPYGNNVDLAKEYAMEEVSGVGDCDVFILLGDEGGTGMYIEMGMALSRATKEGTPKIYIVGEHNERSHFFFHPTVTRKDNLEEVFEDLGI